MIHTQDQNNKLKEDDQKVQSLLSMAIDNKRKQERDAKFVLFNYIVDVWRKNIGKNWIPTIGKHVCDNCIIREIPTEVNAAFTIKKKPEKAFDLIKENNLELMGNSYNKSIINVGINNNNKLSCNIIHIIARLYKSSNPYSNTHVCIKNYCTSELLDKELHYKFIEEVDDVYICDSTGTPYFCNEYCSNEYKITNSDSIYVCRVTGVSFNDVKTVDKFWSKNTAKGADKVISYQRNPYTAGNREKKGEDFSEFDTLIHKCIHIQPNSTETGPKKRPNITNKQNYLEFAIKKISTLFTLERLSYEKKKEAKIKEDFKVSFIKYVSKQTQQQRLLKISDLHILSFMHTNKKNIFTDLSGLTDKLRTKLIVFYAHRCLQLWVIITTRTKYGREDPTRFPWREFIDSAMMLFETGKN